MLIHNKREKELSGGESFTTNNRMEMRAVIEALKILNKPCNVKIHSDSALIVNAFNKGWIQNWLQKGWLKADKKPVENRDLWEELLKAKHQHSVEWIKVKGHSNNELNNRVDRLAVNASKQFR